MEASPLVMSMSRMSRLMVICVLSNGICNPLPNNLNLQIWKSSFGAGAGASALEVRRAVSVLERRRDMISVLEMRRRISVLEGRRGGGVGVGVSVAP